MAEVSISDPFAEVRLSAVQVGKKKIDKRLAVEVKDDGGEWQVKAFVGADYQLMTNRLVYDLAEDMMSRSPVECGGFGHLKTLWNGRQFVAYFASRNPLVEMTGKAGKLQVGLMAWNSYDGSRKVGFEVYALNAFCTNQYHSRNRFGFFAWRHQASDIKQIDREDALQSIGVGIGNVIAMAPALEAMRKTSLALADIQDVKKEIALPQSRWGDVLDRLVQEEANRFGLFQALTFVTTHQMQGMASLGVGSAITDYFLACPRKVVNHTDAETVVAGKA